MQCSLRSWHKPKPATISYYYTPQKTNTALLWKSRNLKSKECRLGQSQICREWWLFSSLFFLGSTDVHPKIPRLFLKVAECTCQYHNNGIRYTFKSNTKTSNFFLWFSHLLVWSIYIHKDFTCPVLIANMDSGFYFLVFKETFHTKNESTSHIV